MAKYKDLMGYYNYEFSTGCYTGEDYKSFQRKYINYLKSIATEYGWELVSTSKGHYWLSAFFKNGNIYAYMSISDVRFFKNEWCNNILYRTAENEKDFHGGQNQYTTLYNLKYSLYKILGSVRYK